MASKEAMQSLTKDEIGQRFWVECKVRPDIPRDRLAQSQLVAAYRQQGADGLPFMADKDIAELADFPHPEELRANVETQMAETNNQDIAQLRQAAIARLWKQQNKETVRLAEKELNPDPDEAWENMKKTLTEEDFGKMVELEVQAKMAEMQGIPREQFMQQLQEGAAQQEAMQQQIGMVPSTVMPPQQGQAPQPHPGAMPSQMMMPNANAQTMVSPDVQQTAQVKRGRPKNKR